MKIKKLYYQGKAKAFNLSYDDGITQDSRFVSLINKCGLKCTFNLNSGIQSENHWWKHESGVFIHRLNKEIILHLYDGHEVASHSFNHQRLTDIKGETLEKEIAEDKKNLEEWFQHEIKGFAYPFGPYNEETTEYVKKAGFKYARVGSISNVSEEFEYSEDPYKWKPSIFQCNPRLETYVHKFIDTDDELALCSIVGHSYELDIFNMWNTMEKLFAKIESLENIWSATTIDIVEYLEAMHNASIENNKIVNKSNKDLWFGINGRTVKVESDSIYNLFME